MSVELPLETLGYSERVQLMRDLRVNPIANTEETTKKISKTKAKYNRFNSGSYVDCYRITNNQSVTIPFSYFWHHMKRGYPNDNKSFSTIDLTFNLKLLPRQVQWKKTALDILNTARSLTLALYTGAGKSLFTLYLCSKIKRKVLILAPRVNLLTQWEKSIERAFGDKVICQRLTTKNKLNIRAHFYTANVTTIPKRNPEDFADIGVLVLDEIHALITKENSKAFSYIFPKYLISCSATPVRPDGMEYINELYTGPYMIYVPLKAVFNYYYLHTGFRPKAEKTEAGDLMWSSILSDQATSLYRNLLIVKLCLLLQNRTILILCKLRIHAEKLKSLLEPLFPGDVDTYMGSEKIVPYHCKILIVTYSKGGMGFDHPSLDCLIVGGDIEEGWEQALGRIFRKEHHYPMVVDLIDKFISLKNHSETRKRICINAGASVLNLYNAWPFWDHWCRIALPINYGEEEN